MQTQSDRRLHLPYCSQRMSEQRTPNNVRWLVPAIRYSLWSFDGWVELCASDVTMLRTIPETETEAFCRNNWFQQEQTQEAQLLADETPESKTNCPRDEKKRRTKLRNRCPYRHGVCKLLSSHRDQAAPKSLTNTISSKVAHRSADTGCKNWTASGENTNSATTEQNKHTDDFSGHKNTVQ